MRSFNVQGRLQKSKEFKKTKKGSENQRGLFPGFYTSICSHTDIFYFPSCNLWPIISSPHDQQVPLQLPS